MMTWVSAKIFSNYFSCSALCQLQIRPFCPHFACQEVMETSSHVLHSDKSMQLIKAQYCLWGRHLEAVVCFNSQSAVASKHQVDPVLFHEPHSPQTMTLSPLSLLLTKFKACNFSSTDIYNSMKFSEYVVGIVALVLSSFHHWRIISTFLQSSHTYAQIGDPLEDPIGKNVMPCRLHICVKLAIGRNIHAESRSSTKSAWPMLEIMAKRGFTTTTSYSRWGGSLCTGRV